MYQQSQLRKRYWIEINDDAKRTYNAGSKIKFKTSMIRSILCDSSNVYIFVKETITVPNTAGVSNTNKKTNI